MSIEPIYKSYTAEGARADFRAREEGWNAGYKRAWEDAKDFYFMRGCMVGGAFVAIVIFLLAFFLGGP